MEPRLDLEIPTWREGADENGVPELVLQPVNVEEVVPRDVLSVPAAAAAIPHGTPSGYRVERPLQAVDLVRISSWYALPPASQRVSLDRLIPGTWLECLRGTTLSYAAELRFILATYNREERRMIQWRRARVLYYNHATGLLFVTFGAAEAGTIHVYNMRHDIEKRAVRLAAERDTSSSSTRNFTDADSSSGGLYRTQSIYA